MVEGKGELKGLFIFTNFDDDHKTLRAYQVIEFFEQYQTVRINWIITNVTANIISLFRLY